MPRIVMFAGVAVALLVAGVATAASSRSIYTYKASLTAGSEIPKPKGAGSAKGTFSATVTENGSTRLLKWKLTFSGLTGKAIGAHVHKGKAGVAGAVLVPLCGPCISGRTGQVKISKDAADLFERGAVYVNVHTAKNTPGEIRGQLKLVGEDDSTAGITPQPGTSTTPSGSSGSGGDPSDGGGYGY
jgi:CHRD domain-containing protein